MVALKDFQLSVNLELISFQIKKENVDAWYKLKRNYFENQNFTIFEEKESLEYYVINFCTSGRTLINTTNYRKELLGKRVSDLESVYGIII